MTFAKLFCMVTSSVAYACLLTRGEQLETSRKLETPSPESATDVEPPPSKDYFTGIIESHQSKDPLSRKLIVIFTIGSDSIRREVSTPGGALDGVIVNRTNDTVILYKRSGNLKHYVQMTGPQYQDFCKYEFNLGSRGIGTIFMGLRPGNYISKNAPHDQKIGGYDCDKLLINHGSSLVTVIETFHSRSVNVNKEMLAQVERDLPVEVEGFPLQIRSITGLRTFFQESDKKSKFKELLSSANNLLSTGLKRVTEETIQVVRVEKKDLGATDFELSSEYTKLPDMKAFEKVFNPPDTGGHSSHHWDD
jgi:hypothetical protein